MARAFIPARANTHGVGADLTDPTWLDAIPTGEVAWAAKHYHGTQSVAGLSAHSTAWSRRGTTVLQYRF